MKKYNKLDITFGAMAFSGKILFLGLLFALLYELISSIIKNGFNANVDYFELMLVLLVSAVIFFVLGFLAFTTSYTKVDYAKKRIKYGTKLSGIIPLGKWTYLTSDMKLGLKKSTERWGLYNQGNRSTSVDYTTLKIYLYDSEGYEIIPIKKIKKAKFAEEELEKLSEVLGVGVIE